MYATQQDIETRIGADRLAVIADRDGDGIADAGLIDQTGADAAAEIDMYLSARRYRLPLATVPAVLVRIAVAITVYRIARSADVATDRERDDYKDAVKQLEKIQAGTLNLGLPTATPAATDDGPQTSAPDRVFTGESLKPFYEDFHP